VGLLLALLLGRRGWRVEVLERQATAFGRPRAVHLDHEAARILQNAGLMDDLAPQTEVMDSYLWRNGDGTPLLWLDGTPEVPAVSGGPRRPCFTSPTGTAADRGGRQATRHTRQDSHDVRETGPDAAAGTVRVRADGPAAPARRSARGG